MEVIQTPTLIIGAGPAGLATAGRMRHLDLPFEIIEQTDRVAWSWHNHYDRLHLHTVKQLSHLPHLPFPEDFPLYVPRLKLIEYFELYTEYFRINPHYNRKVTSIKRTEGQHWTVATENGTVYEAPHVVIATGVNRSPNRPKWEGEEKFEGAIVHSRDYKNPKPFLGKRVLIIGIGNTGAEVALDLAEHDVDTYISVRSPISLVPRDVFGRPVQLTAKKLAKVPFGLGDWLGAQIRKVVIGNLSKYGLPLSKVPPAVQLRETGKTPVIDIGTADMIKKGKIKVLPDITHFTQRGVVLKDKREMDFDAILLATGYKAKVEDFIEDTTGLLDRFQVPKQPIGDGQHQGLYFVGFDNYKLGGILGTIFNDSETVTKRIAEIQSK